MRFLSCLAALSALALSSGIARAAPTPIRVVVVTTFEIGHDTGDTPGEFQTWVERLPLSTTIPAPGTDHDVMRYNPELHVLGIVSGEGPEHMASAITALALDPRFDLRHAYFVLAGISGIDPNFGPVGAAVWAPSVVNGGLAHLIDPREIPADWPDGFTPIQGATPDPKPRPALHSLSGDMAYTLDPGLVRWAYGLTRAVPLPDTPGLRTIRARYTGFPKAQTAPAVLLGDTLSGETFWVGERMNRWAERWVSYWTDNHGTMATTAEEDIGFLQALTAQAKAGRVDARRALILRTASNYDMPPPGQTAAQLLAHETGNEEAYSGFLPSLDAAYRIGSVVVRELATHWDRYDAAPPSAPSP
ncbi:purine nucleoside transporter [Ameyamaea chiangmaiensis NBRC 103196]|uniref:Purine nucleoside permease n=1 Tax=Ameyamaea chiangmaiensis TaxID=442969 RepID=A0A850PCU6_9PROT|nr:purine nucleoside permease [Ameyamaea chiangmaiensis]MBS4075421.1 purine nucleoside permease [Ameyamaea chiangmaiensis]NVN40330.1 purine nucleoside permease [Ameyamaea chiangmaiensis]GBQ69818.1 purine nucleoside transporter [Ameyamaea chiangmaiensis NBRC 103196]